MLYYYHQNEFDQISHGQVLFMNVVLSHPSTMAFSMALTRALSKITLGKMYINYAQLYLLVAFRVRTPRINAV